MFVKFWVSFTRIRTNPGVDFALNSQDAITLIDQSPDTLFNIRWNVWSDHIHLPPVLATPWTGPPMLQAFKPYDMGMRKREQYGALPTHHLLTSSRWISTPRSDCNSASTYVCQCVLLTSLGVDWYESLRV